MRLASHRITYSALRTPPSWFLTMSFDRGAVMMQGGRILLEQLYQPVSQLAKRCDSRDAGSVSSSQNFDDLNEVLDDSEAYCWRRSGFFWRMRASLGLACARVTTLSSQVFGKGNPRSRAGRPSV